MFNGTGQEHATMCVEFRSSFRSFKPEQMYRCIKIKVSRYDEKKFNIIFRLIRYLIAIICAISKGCTIFFVCSCP